MAYKRSDYTLPVESTVASHKFLNPEPSEEPMLHTLNSNETRYGIEKSYLGTGLKPNLDVNLSSLQFSTQQSMNLKSISYLNSPRRSIPSVSNLLANKTGELQDRSLSTKLQHKLTDFEKNDDRFINIETERKDSEASEDLYGHGAAEIKDNELILEGDDDIAIPHLRWCAACKAEVTTKIEFINNSKTFWSSVGIFFSGGILGCFLFPYMTNSCKGKRLICHKCDRVLY